MYLRFYGLQDHPFAVTPDPGYLYLSPHHREALGHLLYGVGEYGGFVALFGEVGTGKTTLIRALLEQEHAELDVALCLNPKLTVLEFVAQICDELGAPRPAGAAGTIKDLVDALNAHLLETHGQGRRTVVIVDEAQNLDRDVLEQLRLLTNLETRKHKLLRIILVGQPELEAMLRRPDLRQLAQRITARYSLCALNRQQTSAYISHRLRVAGGAPSLFDKRACNAVHRATGGVPRLINTVCERALLGGYGQGARN
ncbi:MAG: AAA family ATPase, partial [Salinisphaera sp.]|nr:AAA family ATPase [Salinisphaera sp.]